MILHEHQRTRPRQGSAPRTPGAERGGRFCPASTAHHPIHSRAPIFSPCPKIRTIQERRATLAGEVLAHDFLVAEHLTLACMEQTKEKGLLETLSKGEVLTAKHPGEFAGKQETHVPVVTNTTVPPPARPSESVSRPDSCAAPNPGC